jgi:hypothetical protein
MEKNNLFYSNIITALGIENLPDDKKVVLIDRIAAVVEQRVALRLMKKLDEAAYKKFESLTEGDRIGFLAQVFPDLEAVVREEVATIKGELMNEIKDDELLKAVVTE